MGGQIQEPNTVSRRGFTKAIAALFLTPPAVYIGRNRDLSTKNEPIVRNAYSAANEALIAFDENVDSVASENLTRVVASLKVDLKSFGISKIEYGKISGLEACGASHLGEDRIQIDTDKNQIEELQHVLGHEVGHFVDFNRIDSTTRDQFSEIIGVTPDLNSESPWFSAPVDPPGSQLWAEYCGVLLLGSDPKTYIITMLSPKPNETFSHLTNSPQVLNFKQSWNGWHSQLEYLEAPPFSLKCSH